MNSSFDEWNTLKKHIDVADVPNCFPKAGEVWMSTFGKNIGFEQNGSGDHFPRPVVIIKKFNNQIFWAVPLSSKQKSLDFYFNYTDPEKRTVAAIVAQMRLCSTKRLKRKLYDFEKENFIELLRRIKSFL